MCVDVEKPHYRFLVLFFNCMLTFGSYYCFDMPSVLQDKMQKSFVCNDTSNATCCHDCLGMTYDEYNLLYAIYSFTNAVVVIGAGFFIDKYGNQVVQNRITSFWFSGKELAMAFGITLAFSRLGSVLNFFLTGNLANAVGLQNTLWIGAGLCGLGFLSAIVVGVLDVYGFRRRGMLDSINSQSKKVKVSDVKQFSLTYWLMILTIMFFYNGVFPFVADASKFIKDKYDFDNNKAAYMAGAVYDVSLVLSPFLGGLIDIFGKRGILSVLCAVATIPVFGLLAFTNVHPLVSTMWLGITYSVAAASMWPSIPLVVAQATIGTAMGIATSLQMIGIGCSNFIVGEILGNKDDLPSDEALRRWKYVMIYLLCNTLACVATSIALNIADMRKNGVLNRSRKEARASAAMDAVVNANTADTADTKALVDALESSND